MSTYKSSPASGSRFERSVTPRAATDGIAMPNRSPRVLSFGGGVNSTALLLRLVREGRAPDRVVFADTGEEHPRTYAYLGRVRAFCEERGIPFDVVRSHHGRLVDYYTAARAVPSIQRRDCTTKFKLDPIRRHLRALGYRRVVMLLGIAWDEAHRVSRSPRAWIEHDYPLVEWRMDRAACEAEIAAAGWPSPGKSGCRGCPFAGRNGLLALLREDPDDFERWRRMDETARRANRRISLVPGLSLNRLAGHPEEGERALDYWHGGECLGGACAP
jgi:hypothetical protein